MQAWTWSNRCSTSKPSLSTTRTRFTPRTISTSKKINHEKQNDLYDRRRVVSRHPAGLCSRKRIPEEPPQRFRNDPYQPESGKERIELPVVPRRFVGCEWRED